MTISIPSKKDRGYSLIELIITIVLLSILAVTAIPKIFDLRTDATKVQLKSMASTIASEVDFVFLQAKVKKSPKGKAFNIYYRSTWLSSMGKLTTNYGDPWPNYHLAAKKMFDHMNIGNETGHPLAVSRDKDLRCKSYDYCVQLNKQRNGIIAARDPVSNWWAVYFVPRGYSINDNCFVLYGLDILPEGSSKQQVESRKKVITHRTEGC